MTNFLLAVLILLAAALLLKKDGAFEHHEATAEPLPEKTLPMEICRKARPSIEEQIINMALYNGENQKGGEAE